MRTDGPARDARALLRGTMISLLVTAVLVAVAASLVAGSPGVVGALVGVGLVTVLFGGSAWLLSRVADRAPGTALAVLVGGAFARLALYAVVLVSLAQVAWLDRTSLAGATAVAVVVTLAYELRALTRTPQLYWVDADAARRTVPTATRS